MGRRLYIWVTILALALAIPACGDEEPAQSGDSGSEGSESAETSLKVAFILDGPKDDGGWNQQQDIGRQYLEDEVPGVETTIVEGVSPGRQAQTTFEDLIAQGYDVIVGASYSFVGDIPGTAEAYPDTKFLALGTGTADNLGEVGVASEDGRYLDGMLAGAMTKSNVIGYPSGFPIPEVVRGMNALLLGAREVNPDVVVKPVWINSWFDPPKETQAAEGLVDAGADLLAHELNSPATASVAEQRDSFVIGYGADAADTAPNAWLGSFTFTWGPYYADQVKAIMDGTWKPEVFYGGIPEGMIGRASYGEAVPQDVIDQIAEREKEIADGTFDVFAGPISDNKGEVVVAEGDTIPKEERITCCDFFVEGIEGEIPEG